MSKDRGKPTQQPTDDDEQEGTEQENSTQDTQPPQDPDEITYKKQRRKIKIVVEDDESGLKTIYWLVEGPGTLRGEWMNHLAKQTKVNRHGQAIGMQDFRGMESWLICRCLWDEDRKNLIGQKVIEGFGAEMLGDLFDRCMTMNSLNKKGVEQEGNG